MQRKYYIIVDTEGKQNTRPYDLGVVVMDRLGKIYDRFSLYCFEGREDQLLTIVDEVESMQARNFARIDADQMEKGGKWQKVTFEEVKSLFDDLMCKYHTSTFWAYNCSFDRRLLLNALGVDYMESRQIEFCDIMKAVFPRCLTRRYVNYCIKAGKVTKKGNVQYNAEVVYQYLTGDKDHTEAHTAESDALDEARILFEVLRQHKKIDQSQKIGWQTLSKFVKDCKIVVTLPLCA